MNSVKKGYQPPFSITAKMIQLVAEISENIGRLSTEQKQIKAQRLRRINRIRTIHGSLAIEGNLLDASQIAAIIEGKRVIAPIREIQEARNAILAYEELNHWYFTSEQNLLEAHYVLMKGLLDNAGSYRHSSVGVMDGEKVIHMTPQANRIPKLMGDLFHWLGSTDIHPLIASCIFHYEFEFIHPFADGNGRIGRLWQTLILSHWNPLFEFIPVESLVHEHQAHYYQAINLSSQFVDCAPFIEFMLLMIRDAILTSTHQATQQVKQLIMVLEGEMNRGQLQSALGLKDRNSFRQRYLQPALAAGLIEMSHPEKPSSPSQHYRLTAKGINLKNHHK
ncbi:Fic family protein [Photorhabdus namnaonensis]|uniref:Adenosine monophosphate-protein transferase SoFic n=1 Tax=Photorhabdus namnaonensis TaxID=1851568 RepID=A0A1B8YMX0_9GAMM|nr:Fic family protein [Photorhabdus namnaonensis]OCA56499.1 Adenosine monophosphate-protein transferase SoFic [Photorhabdus namnaonensis]